MKGLGIVGNNSLNDEEKKVLDKIKKNIMDNKEFSLDIARVEINNILNEVLNENMDDIKGVSNE